MSNTSQGDRARRRAVDRGSFLFLGVICIGIGLAVLVVAVGILLTASESADWPTVEGQVVNSYIEESTVFVKYQGMKPVYEAHLEYLYDVDGASYFGDRLGVDTPTHSRDRSYAEAITEAYPVGRTVTVYVSPDDPNMAVLEPGLKGWSWMMPAGAGMLVLVGVGLLVIRGVLLTPRAASADPFKPPVEPAKEAVRLWRDDDTLVIDPKHVVFPMRCLWTNEPVSALSDMVLWVTHEDAPGLPQKIPARLPVNVTC